MNVKFTAWSPSSATDNWLSGVAATGTFKCPTELGTNETIERGVSRCPQNWGVENPPPVEFLQYINTNGAVMSTGYKPGVNTSLSTSLRGTCNGDAFIGFYTGNDTNDWRIFDFRGGLQLDMGGSGSLGDRLQIGSWDTNVWNAVSAYNYGGQLTPEGASTQSASGSRHATADWDPDGVILIGGYNMSTGRSYDCGGLKLYENNVLVKDFRPARMNGVVGMYETVDGVFYYPTGGAWTAYTA